MAGMRDMAEKSARSNFLLMPAVLLLLLGGGDVNTAAGAAASEADRVALRDAPIAAEWVSYLDSSRYAAWCAVRMDVLT